MECVGQSKHGDVEFACDMERRDSEPVGIAMSEGGGGGSGGCGGSRQGLVMVSSAIGEVAEMRLVGPGVLSGSRILAFTAF
jgi:hypothetical protein